MRGGQADAVVSGAEACLREYPTDDELGKRLAIAYLVTAAFGEALPILDGYLSRHPADAEAIRRSQAT